MKSITNWIERHSLPNSVVQGVTLVLFITIPYLSRFGMGKAIAIMLAWVVIANLFSKRPAPETTFGLFDKIALYLLGALLIVGFLDYQFHVIDRIYEFYVLHTLD